MDCCIMSEFKGGLKRGDLWSKGNGKLPDVTGGFSCTVCITTVQLMMCGIWHDNRIFISDVSTLCDSLQWTNVGLQVLLSDTKIKVFQDNN